MMTHITSKNTQILIFLIVNCQIWNMNERECLYYIVREIGKPISKRTLYNYKHQIKLKMTEIPRFPVMSRGKYEYKLKSVAEKYYLNKLRNHMLKNELKGHIFKISDEQLICFSTAMRNILQSPSIHKAEKFLLRCNKMDMLSQQRRQGIPQNATIIREFVNCGKESCRSCSHGPYLYAYWRDGQTKLRKRYIGNSCNKEGQKG